MKKPDLVLCSGSDKNPQYLCYICVRYISLKYINLKVFQFESRVKNTSFCDKVSRFGFSLILETVYVRKRVKETRATQYILYIL